MNAGTDFIIYLAKFTLALGVIMGVLKLALIGAQTLVDRYLR